VGVDEERFFRPPSSWERSRPGKGRNFTSSRCSVSFLPGELSHPLTTARGELSECSASPFSLPERSYRFYVREGFFSPCLQDLRWLGWQRISFPPPDGGIIVMTGVRSGHRGALDTVCSDSPLQRLHAVASSFRDYFARKDLPNFQIKTEIDWEKMEILFHFFQIHYETKSIILRNIHCLSRNANLDSFLQL